ncbi:hypothetical protein ABEB36_007176 [Hypothenemus hampei]|uniref:RNA helicase n=1 Tax=Hypothenemus hampei TaxID=57062 RepID=A0ABD1ETM1_HYPHA
MWSMLKVTKLPIYCSRRFSNTCQQNRILKMKMENLNLNDSSNARRLKQKAHDRLLKLRNFLAMDICNHASKEFEMENITHAVVLNNTTFLRQPKPIENYRFFATKSNTNVNDSIFPLNDTVSQPPLESVSEDQPLLKIYHKFPHPKNILHNFFTILSEELKDKNLKIEPIYKSEEIKKGVMMWTASYNLKWPVEMKITARATSKKLASTKAASDAINFLQKHNKISTEGMPLIYHEREIKKLTKKKETVINLDKTVVDLLTNITQVFDKDLKPLVESTNFKVDNLLEDETEYKSHNLKIPNYLGIQAYMAKEKIKLPITDFKDSFIQLLSKHNCIIVEGKPGCGKSSRVPQYILESWIHQDREALCRIAVTQPRRIAAISLANRVSNERDEPVGHIVGYQVRLQANFQAKTGRIVYCTTGILLRHLQTDPLLRKFSHIVLDEAHERDVNTDLLMNLLKRALNENKNLKLVVMSATINAQAFSDYFNGAPVFNVPGFTFPIKKYFLEHLPVNCPKTLSMCKQDKPQIIHEEVKQLIQYIHETKPPGAILVFLPGWEDLTKLEKLLNRNNDSAVYLLHSKLKDSEQYRIFSKPPPGIRKIILTTNIAETSITIDDVVYVIDTGIHKDNIFDNDKGINVVDNAWISKASANQRTGRAGRCQAGEAFHMYSVEKFEEMTNYTPPKILTTSLTKVVLDSKVYSNNMNACQFLNNLITPPEEIAIQRAVEELKQLELLDQDEHLTPLGRTLINFQLEPCLAKTLVNGVLFKCTTPIVDIITLFSAESGVFGSVTLTGKDALKRVKSQYSSTSDHLALMRLYEKWLELKESENQDVVEQFCRQTNMVSHKLDFLNKLVNINLNYLHTELYHAMPISDQFSDNDELVKAVLYSGTGTVLEHRNWDIVKNRLKTNVNVLVTRHNHKATISPESVNFKRKKFPSNFLVYINETRSNIRRTTIVRECSLIPTISVLLFNSNELEILKVLFIRCFPIDKFIFRTT